MSTRITVRNLAVIKSFLNNKINSDEPEVQQTFDAMNLLLEQHLQVVRGCINTLEGMKYDAEITKGHNEINSVIEKLQQLI